MAASSSRMAGKSAIVTGGARGIGRAIARRFAEEGASVCIADIDVANAQLAASEIGPNCFAFQFDSRNQDSINALVETCVQRNGRIDVLVNNAGVLEAGSVLEVTREQLARIFAVNVEGMLFTMQAVAGQMIRQGQGGNVINLASNASRRGEELLLAYCASKAAVMNITQSAALHLIGKGIRVNAIAPGDMDTEMWDFIDQEFARLTGGQLGDAKEEVTKTIPAGRMGKPDDLAGLAVFLATDDSDYVVAQTIGVDGGNWMA